MKTFMLFLLLPIAAIILMLLGIDSNNQIATFLMALAIIGVGACIVRYT